MTVLYVTSVLREGGPTNQLLYLTENLRGPFQPVFLTLSPEEEDSALPLFEDAGIPVRTLGLSRLEGIVKAPGALRRFVHQIEPAIVHTQGFRADVLAAGWLRGYPCVATVQNQPYHDYPMKYGVLRGRLMAWVQTCALQYLDYPVACSNTVARALEAHGVECSAIQNAVDADRYYPAGEKRKIELRQALDLPPSRPLFLSVGTLIERKDPLTLIEGFLESQAGRKGTLLMVGDGPLRSVCEAKAETAARGKIRFTGWVSNVADYLKAADYFVSASHAEGLPNTVLEAMACGLPAGLSDIPSHRELTGAEEESAHFFSVGDATALARALDKMMHGDRGALAARMVSRIQSRFTAKAMSAAYQKLYEEVLVREGWNKIQRVENPVNDQVTLSNVHK